MRSCLLTWMALGACAAPCPDLARQPVLAACVSGDLPPPTDGVLRFRDELQVIERGPQLEASCLAGWTLGDIERAEALGSEAGWYGLRSGPGAPEYTVGVWADGLGTPPTPIYETWSVDVRIDEEGASYLDLVELGRRVFFLAVGPTLEGLLHPTELILEDGRPMCRRQSDCGAVQGRTMEVEVGGDRRELRPHERLEAEQTGYWRPDLETVVVLGSHDVATDPDDCADEGHVSVAWWERRRL